MGGISRTRSVFLAIVAGIGLIVSGCQAIGGVSRSDEISLGQQAAAQIDAQNHVYDDPTVSQFGQRIAAVSGANYPYRYRVIQDNSVNAFSLPGGPVYINSGMVDFTRSTPDELAAVIAHETAHVALRHSAEQIQRQQWIGLGIGVLTHGTAQDIAALAANIEELGYDRNQERAADEHGAVYLLRAGMDPMAMVRLFSRMQSSGGIPFLQNHPTNAERVRLLQQDIQSGKIRQMAAGNAP